MRNRIADFPIRKFGRIDKTGDRSTGQRKTASLDSIHFRFHFSGYPDLIPYCFSYPFLGAIKLLDFF